MKAKGKKAKQKHREAIVLAPGEGRTYSMGRIQSVFKADNDETGNSYSVSEWWLDANTKGPGVHAHDEDHAWFVIAGTMSVLIGRKWMDAPQGSFIVIPAGIEHNFENRSRTRAGILSFNNQAGFEDAMPGISSWFAANPPENANK